MSLTSARQAIVTQMETAWATAFPSVKVFFENAPQPDPATRNDPFMLLFIDFDDAEQATIGTNHLMRVHGSVQFMPYVQEGTSTKLVFEMLDWLLMNMAIKQFGDVTMQDASPTKELVFDGWFCKGVRVPFYFDVV